MLISQIEYNVTLGSSRDRNSKQ